MRRSIINGSQTGRLGASSITLPTGPHIDKCSPRSGQLVVVDEPRWLVWIGDQFVQQLFGCPRL
jgi:hypothetical protein